MEKIMHSYSIMNLDMEHIDEICADIQSQIENGIAIMPLFMIKLVPEGIPAIDKATPECKKYIIYRDRLRAMGIKSGILAQCTIGHDYALDQMFGFQPYVNLTDGDARYVVCPYDPGFQAYIQQQFAILAQTAPDMIMVDDDFRLIFRAGKGCACPLHLAQIKKRVNAPVTRADLLARMQAEDSADGLYTNAFVGTQGESLIASARAMRAGIDSVDAHIPGSYCCCGPDSEFAADIAEILAGAGNPVVVRINNSCYTPLGMKRFSWKASQRAALAVDLLRDRVDYILAETDTCPQNRYSTSAAFLHAHFTASIIEGARGAKHWITRLFEYEPGAGVAYRKKLAKYSNFYEELAKIGLSLKWKGCRIPTYREMRLSYRELGFYSSNSWGFTVLERLGVPMYYGSAAGGTVFLDENCCHRFTKAQKKAFLHGNCVLTGEAAEMLAREGFAEYTGVQAEQWTGDHPSFEVLHAIGKRVTPQQKMRKLTPISDAVQICSTVYHLHNGKDSIPLFPGSTCYHNPFGGCVTVFAGTCDTEYAFGTAFSFLCGYRKAQFVNILRENGDLPVYYPEDAEVFLKVAETPDRELFCAIFNMGFDPLDELPLTVDRPITRVTRLMPDGTRQPLDFRADGDTLCIQTAVTSPEPAILFLS